ncbi:MAG TPA: DUF3131 domain-containing protein, partial [Kofleriaceae bacterium]|nr:DUF3131 domain-containing protein [Kofleriaceae bacterium]
MVMLGAALWSRPVYGQTCPAPPPTGGPRSPGLAAAQVRGSCLSRPIRPCLRKKAALCDRDLEIARIAWKYFENNYQPTTGFVNAVNKYESTTLWDLASTLAATIAANQLGIIDDRIFDQRVMKLLTTLGAMPLYRDEVPNKVYHSKDLSMVDYGNKPTKFGIGYSALDLARMGTWLDNLSCLYPRHATAAQRTMHRWNYCRMINDGQMFGAGFNATTSEESLNQEGRLGYEQYGARNWEAMGFDMAVSRSYRNMFASSVDIEGVRIPIDVRDPRKLGAFNYVVTESFALEAMEYGTTAESAPLLAAIFEVQKRRWKRTGIVTAVSEDNVDRQPYFVYNTIYAAGSPWNAITDTGKDMEHLKSTSVKAAMSLAVLFPNDPYSQVLFDKIATAYDPDKGWYSGVYEGTQGYNTAVTANTNGIILEAMMYKVYGPLNSVCRKCGHSWELRRLEGESSDTERKQCFPQSRTCFRCGETRKLTALPEKPKAPAPAPPASKPAAAPAPASKPASAPASKPAAKPISAVAPAPRQLAPPAGGAPCAPCAPTLRPK